jgi:ribonuclease HI
MVLDEAINSYGNGIGAVIITPQGTHFSFTTRLTLKCTNNMVEYETCIMGLEEAIDLKIKYLDV